MKYLFPKGKDNPKYKPKKSIECAVCRSIFAVPPYREHTAKYCSRLCADKKPISLEQRKAISNRNKGVIPATCFKKGQKAWNKGVKRWWSSSTEFKKGEGRITGKNQHSWRGGVTPMNRKMRTCVETQKWRKAVFERDNYTCVLCSKESTYLHADHIKSFARFPSIRLDVSNGRTLCVDCHYEITFGRKMPKESKWGRTQHLSV